MRRVVVLLAMLSTSLALPQLQSLHHRGGALGFRRNLRNDAPKSSTEVHAVQQKYPEYNATSLDAGSTPLAELYQILTSTSSGLTGEEARARLELYGANELKQASPKSVWACTYELSVVVL